MAKPRALDSYPAHFWTLSKKALSEKSFFPFELSFDTPKEAQNFRVEFYEFRRALRMALQAKSSKTAEFSPDEVIALQGAELITCPRIDYDAFPCPLTFTLQEKRNMMTSGLQQLDLILGSTKPEPAPKKRGRPVGKNLIEGFSDDPSPLSLEIPYKGSIYDIPLSDIPESKQELPGSKLIVLVASGLCDLKRPLGHYLVTDKDQ